MSRYSVYRRAVLEAVQHNNRRDAAIVRETYTHVVYYKAQTKRCYLASYADCVEFADKVGNCRIERASKAEIEAEAERIERWRPTYI